MRILIRTFPPSSNPNYGGILQAWALQEVLKDLGHVPVTDSTRSNTRSVRLRPVRKFVAKVLRLLSQLGFPTPWREYLIQLAVNERVLRFARNNVKELPVYTSAGVITPKIADRFDAFISGSDQVLRPAYVDVESYLFDFLPLNLNKPRIAYAASFGRSDRSEFDASLQKSTAELVSRFDAFSVRETSGIRVASELWDIPVAQMPDPTVMLPPERYRQLLNSDDRAHGLVVYFLDNSKLKTRVLNVLQALYPQPVKYLLPERTDNYRQVTRDPGRFQKVGVEEWIGSIDRASLFITDSFHGMVFATMLNRPFLVIPNEARGRARFDDFLQGYGLSGLLVESIEDASKALEFRIDWAGVNQRLEAERTRGRDFLSSALG